MDYLSISQLDIKAGFGEKEVLLRRSYKLPAPDSIYLRDLKGNMVEITTITCKLLPTTTSIPEDWEWTI